MQFVAVCGPCSAWRALPQTLSPKPLSVLEELIRVYVTDIGFESGRSRVTKITLFLFSKVSNATSVP